MSTRTSWHADWGGADSDDALSRDTKGTSRTSVAASLRGEEEARAAGPTVADALPDPMKDMQPSDLTIEILRGIRDEVRQTNARLDQTNARLDQTNARPATGVRHDISSVRD